MKTTSLLHLFLLGSLLWLVAPVSGAADPSTKPELTAIEQRLLPLATGAAPQASACLELGWVRLRQGRPRDAIAFMEKAVELDPAKPEHHSALGAAIGQLMGELTFLEQGLHARKMKKAFNRSIELDPNHLPGLIGLARYCTNAPAVAGGSIAKATEYANKVRTLNPLLGELELARIAEADEDLATARRHYSAALALDSANAQAKSALARLDRGK